MIMRSIGCLLGIVQIAAIFKINLERHVDLKLEYNATRAYKHGKSF